MKKVTVIFVTIFLCTVLVSTVYANGFTLWQIGKPDGPVNPIAGSAEYPAAGLWYGTFTYTVGSDLDPVNAPNIPGYIGLHNVCYYAPGRPCTDTAQMLNIQFELDCEYSSAGDLTLLYDRYGSESDELYLEIDSSPFATISGTEGGFRQFSFDLVDLLGPISDGGHTLTIEYAGGGSGNGHYMDYLKLESAIDPSTCITIPVVIDIKPGSYPNCFNMNGNGVIPVAILGSADFDVAQIDVSTLNFAGLEVRVKGNDNLQCSLEDVSGDFISPEGAPDGFRDLVCQFVDDPTTWSPDDGTATLTGNLLSEFDGTPFEGSDEICLKP